MLKKILPFLILLFTGCCGNSMVQFDHQDHATPASVERMKTAGFGFIFLGKSIAGLKAVVEKDVSRYQGRQVRVAELHPDEDHLAKLKKEDFSGDDWEKYDTDLIFVILQDKSDFKKDRHCQREGEKSSDSYGHQQKLKRDRCTYSITISVNCRTYLVDRQNHTLLAKSSKTFSHQEKKDVSDRFANNTLLGGIEDFIDLIGNDDAKYPELLFIDGKDIGGYFYNYLSCLEHNRRFSTSFFEWAWLPLPWAWP